VKKKKKKKKKTKENDTSKAFRPGHGNFVKLADGGATVLRVKIPKDHVVVFADLLEDLEPGVTYESMLLTHTGTNAAASTSNLYRTSLGAGEQGHQIWTAKKWIRFVDLCDHLAAPE
jgi:hypothetical protein